MSPEVEAEVIEFLEMLASEPFMGTPSTTDEAKRLVLAIRQEQQDS